MTTVSAIAVYCGSKPGNNPAYAEAAQALGAAFAARGIRLVYGGGRIGLMGLVADSVLAGGGEVTGVIPRFLSEWEVEHQFVTELVEVDTMHERKQRMFDAADAFVILPGGLGTLEEAFEVITWKQLRQHDKPIIVLDVDGYWQHLLALVDGVIAEGFAHPAARDLFTSVTRVDEVFDAIAAAPPPHMDVFTDHL